MTQETGFSDVIRVGEGVMSFTSPDEAIAMIEEVATRYDFHCRAAREVAEAEFDAGKVLTRLIETAMSADTEPRPSPLHRELKA